MTEKENYLKVLKGEKPEWVPVYMDACQWGGPVVYENVPVDGGNPAVKVRDLLGGERNDRETFTDMLGVEFTITVDGQLPTPGKFICTDITRWREQINYPFPDLDKIDFQVQAENFFRVFDHEQKALALMSGSFFMNLSNIMGFTEALIAIAEEPEAVMDFFREQGAYEEKKLRLAMPHFKPDVVIIGDDVATARNLFFSPKTYREILAPFHLQIAQTIRELGAIAEMHCCGRCEALIPDWLDMGITAWQPAQPVNDLAGIQRKYGKRLVLNGCWDTRGRGGVPGASEAEVRASVRETIDALAPAGGFVFWDGGITGGDTQKFIWTADEARRYGKNFRRE